MNDEQDPKENPWMKSMVIWAGVIIALLLTVSMFGAGAASDSGSAISYSSFRNKVEEGSVKSVAIAPDKIHRRTHQWRHVLNHAGWQRSVAGHIAR